MPGASRSAGGASRSAPPDTFLRQYAATRRFQAGIPGSYAITPAGDAVLFLRSGPRGFVQDLFEFDVARGRERVLFTTEQILRGAAENLPPEEKARRERTRQSSRGITSFQLSEDGRKLLVPLAGRLFVIDRASRAVQELMAISPGFPIDPRLSPDARKVACIRNRDLYVIDVESGVERRLTSSADDTLSNGLAEFVAQEEMDRFQGYWWSPDSRTIAYQQTNESGVEVLSWLDPVHPEGTPQGSRYPRAGRKNAEVRLGLIPVDGGSTTWVKWDRERFPYLAAVNWSRNTPLTILVQSRRQTEELLLSVKPSRGETKRLLAEHDPAWINLDPSVPRWLSDGSGFLWSTERNQGWQLELRAADGRLLRALTPVELRYRRLLGLDEERRVAWIQAGAEPTEAHIYRVPLDASAGQPERVTVEPGLHYGTFATFGGAGIWVHRQLGLSIKPIQTVCRADGKAVGSIASVAETPPFEPNLEIVTLGPPLRMRAAIVRPRSFDPSRRYPVIVSVYGGPRGKMVTANRRSQVLDQWMADQGFIVVSVDGRGTPDRGRAWERAIRGDLIAVPLADQIEGLRQLGARFRELDLGRVGIYGWSFGGYFSTMAILRHPEWFQAAVAGAPVVDWEDYDTHYTERYMGLPAENRRGYRAANVLTYVDRLRRPLLLIHGTDDDNVYFTHSIKLSDALFRAGKEFELLPLSGYTHMVNDPQTVERLQSRIVSFLRAHLGAPIAMR